MAAESQATTEVDAWISEMSTAKKPPVQTANIKDIAQETAKRLAGVGGPKSSAQFVESGKRWISGATVPDLIGLLGGYPTYTFSIKKNEELHKTHKEQQKEAFKRFEGRLTNVEQTRPYQNDSSKYENIQKALAAINTRAGFTAEEIKMSWGTFFQLPLVIQTMVAIKNHFLVVRPQNQQFIYNPALVVSAGFADGYSMIYARLKCCHLVVAAVDKLPDKGIDPEIQFRTGIKKDAVIEAYGAVSKAFSLPIMQLLPSLNKLDSPFQRLAVAIHAAFPMDPVHLTKTSEYRQARGKGGEVITDMDKKVTGLIKAVVVMVTGKMMNAPIRSFEKTDAGMVEYREARRILSLTIRSVKYTMGGRTAAGPNTRAHHVVEGDVTDLSWSEV